MFFHKHLAHSFAIFRFPNFSDAFQIWLTIRYVIFYPSGICRTYSASKTFSTDPYWMNLQRKQTSSFNIIFIIYHLSDETEHEWTLLWNPICLLSAYYFGNEQRVPDQCEEIDFSYSNKCLYGRRIIRWLRSYDASSGEFYQTDIIRLFARNHNYQGVHLVDFADTGKLLCLRTLPEGFF